MRFIPAHAGNSSRCNPASMWRPVHPRARGEQMYSTALGTLDSGSSPRTRGTGRHQPHRHRLRRFIPPHAGNRQGAAARRSFRTVHPRARGEQSKTTRRRPSLAGSSPRKRGTGPVRCGRLHRPRFIPAHAGNRSPDCRCWPLVSVHPRARGEQHIQRADLLALVGSSPRTRGTVGFQDSGLLQRRFIPAHAGNRAFRAERRSISSVHPRARGEQRRCGRSLSSTCGSSPRTRGTGRRTGAAWPRQRFIPAHAGNSSSPRL